MSSPLENGPAAGITTVPVSPNFVAVTKALYLGLPLNAYEKANLRMYANGLKSPDSPMDTIGDALTALVVTGFFYGITPKLSDNPPASEDDMVEAIYNKLISLTN